MLTFEGFSDIAFNPEKSLNCQARSAAVYVALHQRGVLAQTLATPETFLQALVHADKDGDDSATRGTDTQLPLF